MVRLLLVLAGVMTVTLVGRFRHRSRFTPQVEGNLDGPGVYLFTAAGCDTCEEARIVHRQVLGANGFTEISWEEHSDLLARVGVTGIPLSVVVGSKGQAVTLPHIPKPRALRRAAKKMRI
ncbi:MAG: hypothetical protein F4Y75_00315 [Acidimicrobiia bacterium]|nr:hypothetical protein [bacterium]MXZ05955.1 hypothetical protein [Acidimicrobiia bacterium]MYH55573.1 hypothetical protein [Acidimicrobiia bacterium]